MSITTHYIIYNPVYNCILRLFGNDTNGLTSSYFDIKTFPAFNIIDNFGIINEQKINIMHVCNIKHNENNYDFYITVKYYDIFSIVVKLEHIIINHEDLSNVIIPSTNPFLFTDNLDIQKEVILQYIILKLHSNYDKNTIYKMSDGWIEAHIQLLMTQMKITKDILPEILIEIKKYIQDFKYDKIDTLYDLDAKKNEILELYNTVFRDKKDVLNNIINFVNRIHDIPSNLLLRNDNDSSISKSTKIMMWVHTLLSITKMVGYIIIVEFPIYAMYEHYDDPSHNCNNNYGEHIEFIYKNYFRHQFKK